MISTYKNDYRLTNDPGPNGWNHSLSGTFLTFSVIGGMFFVMPLNGVMREGVPLSLLTAIECCIGTIIYFSDATGSGTGTAAKIVSSVTLSL